MEKEIGGSEYTCRAPALILTPDSLSLVNTSRRPRVLTIELCVRQLRAKPSGVALQIRSSEKWKGSRAMEALIQDVRYALRLLLKRPGFTLVAALALALGVGANTAIFSVVNAVLLKALPYPDSEQLVWFWEVQPQLEQAPFSPADFLDYQSQNNSFAEVAASRPMSFNLTGGERPERLNANIVTANFFDVLRVQPVQGRAFAADDGQAGARRVAVVSYGFWQSHSAGDADFVGRTLTLNNEPVTVIGVMPQDFKFGGDTELWVNPRQVVPEPFSSFTDDVLAVRGMHYLRVVGRLKPGVTLTQAQADIDAIVARLQQQYHSNHSVHLVALHEAIIGNLRPALVVLMVAVGLVLLVACANVANLLLARATARYREMAIRTALGAGRARIVRQLLTESLLLALLGGALGLVLGWWGVDLLVAVSPPDTPRLAEIGIDRNVFFFTLILSMATGFIFGLAPALQASKANLNEALKEGGRTADASRRNRVRSLLVVAEVALSLVVLVGAGLLAKSFVRVLDVAPGFNPANLLTASLSLPGKKYERQSQINAFCKQLIERLEALPGVEGVAIANDIPFMGDDTSTYPTVEGREATRDEDRFLLGQHAVSTGYFKALGVRLLSGREFSAADSADATPVAIINETAARKLWPDEDPLGKRFRLGDARSPWLQVVGVVGDVKHNGLESESSLEAYAPFAQMAYPYFSVMLRAGNAASFAEAIRQEVQGVDNDQPVHDVMMMEAILSRSEAPRRLAMALFVLFGGVAMLLAAVGIYGVMSYSVTQRTHEIGVRMALGAGRRDVLRLIVGQGMRLALVGVSAGLLAAVAATRLMKSLLFAVSATDAATFVMVAAALTLVALGACFVPALRATRVDPMVALRYE
jgi:putative ABC transport system permease protein